MRKIGRVRAEKVEFSSGLWTFLRNISVTNLCLYLSILRAEIVSNNYTNPDKKFLKIDHVGHLVFLCNQGRSCLGAKVCWAHPGKSRAHPEKNCILKQITSPSMNDVVHSLGFASLYCFILKISPAAHYLYSYNYIEF